MGFHLAYFGFDGTATPEIVDQLWRQAASCAADEHVSLQCTLTAITTVDDVEVRLLVSQDFDLLQRRGQGVADVGVASEAAHANDEAFIQGRRDADLAAELLAPPRLALRDAIDLGLMQGIDLVAGLGRLMQQVRD